MLLDWKFMGGGREGGHRGRGPFGGRGGRHGHGHGGGGFGRGFGGFGRGMRAARMLASEDLQLVVLSLLEEKSRHGYEMIKDLEAKSGGFYTPSPGVIYPALTYLEEAGFAVSEADGNKKLYKITSEGSAHLEKNREVAQETLRQLSSMGAKMAKMRRFFADEEAENDLDESSGREGSRAEWRKFKMAFREIREDLRTALFELVDASTEEKERVLEILKKALSEIRKK